MDHSYEQFVGTGWLNVEHPLVIYYLNETLKAAALQIEWSKRVIEYPYAFSEGAT